MTNAADDFEAIAKRMKELAQAETELPAGSIPDEIAVEPKTGKRYRWTGKEWLEEEYTMPIFSFLKPRHISVDPPILSRFDWIDYGVGPVITELGLTRAIARRLANLRALSCHRLLQRDV